MRRELPTGTVTFLFTDIEGSTELLRELGPDAYAAALAQHRATVRTAIAGHGGVEVDTQGDSFFVAFGTAAAALDAAAEAQAALTVPVRMGVHTGTPLVSDGGYVGIDVHKAARIAAAAHGRQVLVSAATAALVDEAKLRNLGEHRLKDLSSAERIFQLGHEEFPRPKTLYQTNLPVPATPFVGRQQELAQIDASLRQDSPRVLTLCGPGGTGKTRLALQSAGAAADAYPDGVFLVPLAPLRDPGLVMAEAAQAVGAQEELVDFVGEKRMLLLLDNFEHLIDAAPDVAQVVGRCPNLHLLVTSRELLRIEAEQAYPVPPLAPAEGVELFTARARALDTTFEPGPEIAELCRALENLPLAVELAAARVGALSPAQLLARLGRRLDLLKGRRDADPRQQTLRATIEWSYDLLHESEQSLFARLSVFRGGWSLEAAEEVADAELDTLESLIDKSLVRRRDGRYSMLETIREFAAEVFGRSSEQAAAQERHASFFLQLARAHSDSTAASIRSITEEHDNLRAVREHYGARGDTASELELLRALTSYLDIHGHIEEGLGWAADLLERVDDPADRRTPLYARARLLIRTGSDDEARAAAEEAIRLFAAASEQTEQARAGIILSSAYANSEDYAAARRAAAEALRIFRELGAERDVLGTTINMGTFALVQNDLAEARRLIEAAYALAAPLGEDYLIGVALTNLAIIAVREGSPDDAVRYIDEAVDCYNRAGYERGVVECLVPLAAAAAAARDLALAARLLGAAHSAHRSAGTTIESPERELHEEVVATLRAELGEAEATRLWDEGAKLEVDEALGLVYAAPPNLGAAARS